MTRLKKKKRKSSNSKTYHCYHQMEKLLVKKIKNKLKGKEESLKFFSHTYLKNQQSTIQISVISLTVSIKD